MALVTETVTINSKQFKHIYSNGGYYVLGPDGKQYIDVYEPSGSTKTFTETTIVAPQTVTQRYFENRLLTKCDLDLSNSTRPHIIETYSSGTEWYRVFSDKFCEQASLIEAKETSVTLKKSYKDTNYGILMIGSNYGNSDQALGVTSKTANTFTVKDSSYIRYYLAQGFIA